MIILYLCLWALADTPHIRGAWLVLFVLAVFLDYRAAVKS